MDRRFFLHGLFASVAGPALANSPAQSVRPVMRPYGTLQSAQALVRASKLSGQTSLVFSDLKDGRILASSSPLRALPPASVAKILTALYGLERLGSEFRFETRLGYAGTLVDGRLEGDLVLLGGGDPTLTTDDLAYLAAQAKSAGLREVTGRLLVWGGRLPQSDMIDANQPDHVGYNPAVSGMNLNFNRVHFEWLREAGDYTVRMDARSARIRPGVTRQRMRVADRDAPVYTYDAAEGRENWTVARAALGNGGSRWLPVRDPALYAAEVFQILARSHGIVLDGPDIAAIAPPDGLVMVDQTSPPLDEITRDMLRWSTNLTAETLGLSASIAGGAQPETLTQSAGMMSDWMVQRLGARRPAFVDHSGLGPDSRITAADMVRCLIAAGPEGALRGLMRNHVMRDADGAAVSDHPVQVSAKTGTLNFVSALAGYAQAPTGRVIAFAVFCADLPRREALNPDEVERPQGGRSYSRRARRLQQSLIERWAGVYG